MTILKKFLCKKGHDLKTNPSYRISQNDYLCHSCLVDEFGFNEQRIFQIEEGKFYRMVNNKSVYIFCIRPESDGDQGKAYGVHDGINTFYKYTLGGKVVDADEFYDIIEEWPKEYDED